MPQDVICDIETLDTRPSAAILSIALIKFDLDGEDNYDTINDPERCFYAVIDADDQIANYGRTVSFSTLKFWVDQKPTVTHEVFQKKPQPVEKVLKAISAWLGKSEASMWGNGATFDNVLMESLYADYGVKFPFNYWAHMDLRTLKMLAGNPRKVPIDRDHTHHALYDAMYEVLCAQHYYDLIFNVRRGE